MAWLGKKLRFDYVQLLTSTEEEICEVKLAVASMMMDAISLSNLSKKTLRGIEAAILAGWLAGGRINGYRWEVDRAKCT